MVVTEWFADVRRLSASRVRGRGVRGATTVAMAVGIKVRLGLAEDDLPEKSDRRQSSASIGSRNCVPESYLLRDGNLCTPMTNGRPRWVRVKAT